MNVLTRRTYSWLVLLLLTTSFTSALAQIVPGSSPVGLQNEDAPIHRTWQFGAFFAGGFPPFYELHGGGVRISEELHLFNAGFEAGRMITPPLRHGRGEATLEIIPFWLAHYPKQQDRFIGSDGTRSLIQREEFNIHGASISPLLFRWNFTKQESNRFVPWIQLGSGLLWTTKRFPQGIGEPGGNTSRINFTPQVDFGGTIFSKKNQSANLAVKVIHISSAGIGEYNPGVNVTLQFSLGYSWWK